MHTGNTSFTSISILALTVHPRAYGEHQYGIDRRQCETGSSPCIRGTLLGRSGRPFPLRFIPVHTGNTHQGFRCFRCPAVHPRAYGEHQIKMCRRVITIGSSPCIRGTLMSVPLTYFGDRFIPVHTGNTLLIKHWEPVKAVHPRAYGEHVRDVANFKTIRRFIPVHTGNTNRSISLLLILAVHPRAYGEHPPSAVPSAVVFGSSPCIRGTRDGTVCFSPIQRFIPVHTGNTAAPSPSYSASPVHPRAYGEHPGICSSSRSYRFIPVHTGNTLWSSWTPIIKSVHPRAYGEHSHSHLTMRVVCGSSPCIRGTPS